MAEEEKEAAAPDESAEASESVEESAEASESVEESTEASESVEESAEASESVEESAEASEPVTKSEDKEVVEGKFGKVLVKIPNTVQKAPFESQKHYESIASKGATFKTASEQVLNADSKDDLKASLPTAIVVKKNLKKGVDALYSNYKEYKSKTDNSEEVQQFKEACNTVIRDAQKAHGEIKDKIHSVYGKS